MAKNLILVHRIHPAGHQSTSRWTGRKRGIWKIVVPQLLSGDRLTGVHLLETFTGDKSVVDCDGVFVSVGRQPATAPVVNWRWTAAAIRGRRDRTSIPGVYAVGDVRKAPVRWSPPWRTARWQSTWQEIYAENR